MGVDGSKDHAVTAVGDVIFDSRLPKAMKLCHESIDWICGVHGCLELGVCYSFDLTNKRKEKHMSLLKNW